MPYADVNGLHMYYEVRGAGSPLVLLHGGIMTTELSFGALIPELAKRHEVIGVEAQGHGRTADIDREITPAALASDVVALLDVLGIERAHAFGHSLGGDAAMELAVSYPHRLRSVVVASVSVRPDGMLEDITDRMPTERDFADMRQAYTELSPHPEHFDDFFAAQAENAADLQGWSDEQLAGITAPTLIVLGDRDFMTVEHGALMQRLIPDSQLAILPGATHMDVPRRADLVLPMLAAFLN